MKYCSEIIVPRNLSPQVTDIFLEIGGFFGDCIVVAAVSGWAQIGTIELDGSRLAIRQLNRTVEESFERVEGVNITVTEGGEGTVVTKGTVVTERTQRITSALSTSLRNGKSTIGDSHNVIGSGKSGNGMEILNLAENSKKISNPILPISDLYKNPFNGADYFFIKAADFFVSDKSGWFRQRPKGGSSAGEESGMSEGTTNPGPEGRIQIANCPQWVVNFAPQKILKHKSALYTNFEFATVYSTQRGIRTPKKC